MMKKILLSFIILALGITLAGCNKEFFKEKVNLNIWHYYNNQQETVFSEIVDRFNNTKGKELNIEVTAQAKGYNDDLIRAIMDSANDKVGSGELPSMFMAYADTAYEVDRLGKVAALDKYLTAKELDEYVPNFIEVGRFSEDKSLKIFPFAKSTEALMVNKTDFDKFILADKTVTYEMLNTIEGIVQVAKKYYDWCGKAFYGRDSLSNYFIIGAKQLGIDLFYRKNGVFELNLDKEVIKHLWDYYYIPYISGYFSSFGKFRSVDVSTNSIIAYTGATSSAPFFPKQVVISDDNTYNIECFVTTAPKFDQTDFYAVQQGAGIVVKKASENEERASMIFLKWLTEKENNVDFAVKSSYIPVKKNAISDDVVDKLPSIEKQTFEVCRNILNNAKLYTNIASEHGESIRTILDKNLETLAKKDRTLIIDRIAKGENREEILMEYSSEEYFMQWYESFTAAMNKAYSN